MHLPQHNQDSMEEEAVEGKEEEQEGVVDEAVPEDPKPDSASGSKHKCS